MAQRRTEPTISGNEPPTSFVLFTSEPARNTVKPTFSGHETFTLRHSWLKKGVDGLLAYPDLYSRDDGMVILGLGKNMVRANRYWCIACRVIEEGEFIASTRTRSLHVTELGRRLLLDDGWDPYLEDDGTIWLIHWNIATNWERTATWYWVYNLSRERVFTPDELNASISRWADDHNSTPSKDTLQADISCFIRTYVAVRRGPASTSDETLDSPLATLGLVQDISPNADDRRYRLNVGVKRTLPSAIFVYALIQYWKVYKPEQGTLSLRDITHDESSPGRVFLLDEDAVLQHLDRLDELTRGQLVFSDTSLNRQAVNQSNTPISDLNALDILHAYYN